MSWLPKLNALQGGVVSGGSSLPQVTVYTASGALNVADDLAILNSTANLGMTLAAGLTDGHEMVIVRPLASGGQHGVTGNFNEQAAQSLGTFGSPNGGEAFVIKWIAARSTWYRKGQFDPGYKISDLPNATTLLGTELFDLYQSGNDAQTTLNAITAFILMQSPAPITLTGNTTLGAAHAGAELWANTALTMTLPAASTLGNFKCSIRTLPGGSITFAGATLNDLTVQPITSLPASRSASITTYNNAFYGIIAGQQASSASNATSFTTSPTTSTIQSGGTITYSFTPNAAWQAGQTIGLVLNGITGTFGTVTNGTYSGGVLTPTAGNANPVTIVLTVTSANGSSGSVGVSGTNITAVNTTETVTVSAALAAPAVTSNPSISGTAQVGSTLTLADGAASGNPAPSVASRAWYRDGTTLINGATGTSYIPNSSDIGHTIVAKVTWSSSQGNAVGTSPATSAVIAASGGTSGYPTLSTPNVQRVLILDANAGILPNSTQGTTVTGMQDQSGNGRNFTSTVGVTVGTPVNGKPSIAFASSQLSSANSGVLAQPTGSPSWLQAMKNTNVVGNSLAVILAVQAKASMLAADQSLLHIADSANIYGDGIALYYTGASSPGKVLFRVRTSGGQAVDTYSPSPIAAGAVHTLAIRATCTYATQFTDTGTYAYDAWLDGTKITSGSATSGWGWGNTEPWTDIIFGQAISAGGSGNTGASSFQFLESHILWSPNSQILDSDITSYVAPSTGYLSRWGT